MTKYNYAMRQVLECAFDALLTQSDYQSFIKELDFTVDDALSDKDVVEFWDQIQKGYQLSVFIGDSTLSPSIAP